MYDSIVTANIFLYLSKPIANLIQTHAPTVSLHGFISTARLISYCRSLLLALLLCSYALSVYDIVDGP